MRRAAPDVAADADPQTGVSVYSSTPVDRQSGWFRHGRHQRRAHRSGPGVLAVANGLRKAVGKGPLVAATSTGATPLHTALYSSAVRSSPSLFDVVSGTNGTCGGVCTAAAGYDTVTGLGSPRRGLDVVLRDQP